MKKTKIHIFRKNQISKEKNMKEGMWGVSGNIKKMTVELKLALTKQKRTLRAVPLKSSNNTLLEITPGKIDKEKMFLTIKKAIKNSKLEKEEFMAALPAGGIRIDK
jgi:(p)ppGpp synthase/HD superfamily hydrolase